MKTLMFFGMVTDDAFPVCRQGGYRYNLTGDFIEDSLCIVPCRKGKMQGFSVYVLSRIASALSRVEKGRCRGFLYMCMNET